MTFNNLFADGQADTAAGQLHEWMETQKTCARV